MFSNYIKELHLLNIHIANVEGETKFIDILKPNFNGLNVLHNNKQNQATHVNLHENYHNI